MGCELLVISVQSPVGININYFNYNHWNTHTETFFIIQSNPTATISSLAVAVPVERELGDKSCMSLI